MKSLIIFLSILLIPINLAFAQSPQAELTPLLTVEGRIIAKHGFILLITQEGKGYFLKKAEDFDEVFNKIKEFVGQDFDLIISGIDTGEIKGFKHTDYADQKAFVEKYIVLEPLLINGIKKGSKVSEINISKPAPVEKIPESLLLEAMSFKKISGRISKCNFRSVIPTIELERKNEFTFLLSPSTQVMKVVDENLMTFKATEEILKEGMKVEILFDQRDNIKTAKIITIK